MAVMAVASNRQQPNHQIIRLMQIDRHNSIFTWAQKRVPCRWAGPSLWWKNVDAKGPQSTGSGRSRIETGVRTLRKLPTFFNIGNKISKNNAYSSFLLCFFIWRLNFEMRTDRINSRLAWSCLSRVSEYHHITSKWYKARLRRILIRQVFQRTLP